MLREADYTFYWKGKAQEQTRLHGVGFAVKNSLLPTIVSPVGVSERLLSISMMTTSGKVTLISAYAPTLCSLQEDKDKFYEDLMEAIETIPQKEQMVILGDFNARVGADHTTWPDCLRLLGIGRMNENGQRLLEFCAYHKLCITNTYFKTKPQHCVSWRHPRSAHWHQLDMTLTRKRDIGNILMTRSFQRADCDTDHTLVSCRTRLLPTKIHSSQGKRKARLNTANTNNADLSIEFTKKLEEAFKNFSVTEIEKTWTLIHDTTSSLVFSNKTKKNEDWFEASLQEMETTTRSKRVAMLNYKKEPTPNTTYKRSDLLETMPKE
uniref:Endonuclease/exonuclease/phosphatase domain-containing protein n=1 Tax=Biomphalaria glabrata TaxID=6526 RepID=A0A2C9KRI8_BIOGL